MTYKIMNPLTAYPATCSYILFVILLNTMFSYLPEQHFLGQPLSFADFVVGFIYVFRDFAQRETKHWIIVAMLVACAISYLLAEKDAAIASLGAFTVGESIDWAIFTFTKKPLSERLLWSSLISAPADSIVNLYLLTQLNWAGLMVMTIVKSLGIITLWGFWQLRYKKSTTTTSLSQN